MADKLELGILVKVYDQASSIFKNISSGLSKLSDPAEKLSKKLALQGVAISAGLGGSIAALGYKSIKAAMEVEDLADSVNLYTKNAEEAATLTEQLDKLVIKLPFDSSVTEKAAASLLRFGLSANNIAPSLKMLSDISVGSKMDMTELVEIYGKVINRGKAIQRDVVSLGMNGIKVVDILAKKTGLSKLQIQDMISKGVMKASDLTAVFKELTKEGGLFFDKTAKEAGDLDALFMSLANSIHSIFKTIGPIIKNSLNLEEAIPKAVKYISELTEKIKKFSEEHPALTKFIIIMGGFLAILGPIIIGIAALVGAFATLIGGATAVGIITGSIVALTAAIASLLTWKDEIIDFFDGLGITLKEPIVKYLKEKVGLGDISSMLGLNLFGENDNEISNILKKQEAINLLKGKAGSSQLNDMLGINKVISDIKVAPIRNDSLIKNNSKTDINIKLSAPPGYGARIEDKRTTGFDTNVNFLSPSYRGDSQMVPSF